MFLGGGNLFSAYAGVVSTLSEMGHEINEVMAIGSGSLVAAGMASGYKFNYELHSLTRQISNDIHNQPILKENKLHKSWGLYDTNKLKGKLDKYYVPYLNDASLDFSVILTGLEKEEIFSTNTHKQNRMSGIAAASLATSLLYTPCEIDKKEYISVGSNIKLSLNNYIRQGYVPVWIRSTKNDLKGGLPGLIKYRQNGNDVCTLNPDEGIEVLVEEYSLYEPLTASVINDLIVAGERAAERYK